MSACSFTLLGSGSSTGVPWLRCVLCPETRCAVCAGCMRGDAAGRLNTRNNISGLLSVPHADGRTRHIMIDCGKTFRSAAMSQLAALGVERLDAVLLTHPHADAVGGLDDLRDVSPRALLPVYCGEATFRRIAAGSDYLVRASARPLGTFTALLDWRIIRPFEPFTLADTGLLVVPLPLEHCEPGPMLGFEFYWTTIQAGAPRAPAAAATAAADADATTATAAVATASRLVFLSDLSALPLDTRAYLKRGAPIDVLMLDALAWTPYPTHFSVAQALACAADLGAARTVLVGMSHAIDYAVEQPRLAALAAPECGGLSVELGYDGFTLPLSLHAPVMRADVTAELRSAHAEAQREWVAGGDLAARCGLDGAAASPAIVDAAVGAPRRPSPLDADFDAADATARAAGEDFCGWLAPGAFALLLPLVVPGNAEAPQPLPPPPPPPPSAAAWPCARGNPPALFYRDAEQLFPHFAADRALKK